MDLAVYIGELLRQQGKLGIPGMGVFSQVRKDGYYMEDRSVFHPPHYETSFEEQATDDATLANYISRKKNISVASATYFVEKYVNNIKQQAAEADISVDQLGWMRLQNNRLKFKSNAASSTYEQEYFGLPALSVDKIWDQLSGFRKTPQVVEEPAEPEVNTFATPVTASLPAAPVAEPAAAPTPELAMFPEVLTLREDKPEPVKPAKPAKSKRAQEIPATVETAEPAAPKITTNIWILVLIIVTVAAIILLALYQYKPGLFSHRATPQRVAVSHGNDDTVVAEKRIDTLQTSQSKLSTAPVVATTPADTSKADTTAAAQHATTVQVGHAVTTAVPAATAILQQGYEIMGGAFANAKQARQAIAEYKKVGVTARIFENLPKRKVKLTLGSYSSYDEANAHLHQLQAAGKATKDAYVQRPK
jgi:hypothetical protein